MISEINQLLNKKVLLSEGVETDGYSLFFRALIFLITASWISFYPAYLLLIHMHTEKFFSYDVFVSGLFGVKSFLLVVFILISISSIYCWSFILFFRKAVLSRETHFYVLGIIFAVVSILFHYMMFWAGISSGNPERMLWLSALGLVFAVAISAYLSNPLENFVSNWAAPLLGILASASLPIMFPNTASDIVKTGLENFKVGGGVSAEIYEVDNDKLIKSGKLLLLTPGYIFIREKETGYISISRSNDTYVSVESNTNEQGNK